MPFPVRHLRLIVFLFALGPGLAPASTAAEDKSTTIVLQLPDTAQFEFAGYYAAEAQGYFQEEGLAVTLRLGGAGLRPVAEVTGGAAQYGVEASALLVARLRGAPVVLVSSIFQHSSVALAVLSKTGMAMPADLAGKRVALDPHGSTPEIQAMLYAGGIAPVQYTPVPNQWGVSEIETGTADAMVINSWQAEQDFKSRGMKVQLIRPSDYGVDFYGDNLFTSETEARENPERVEAMRRAVLRGWHYALENPDEIIRWMLAHQADHLGPLDEPRLQAEAAETSGLINANLISIGHVNPERWSRLANLVVRSGLAPDARRLQGFIFLGPVDQWPRWGKWLFGVLALVLALAFLGFLTNRRLLRLVERRTRELRESESVQRQYFEMAPAPIVIENYVALESALAHFTEEGVTDLRQHLLARPELVSRLFKLKRVVAANRLALARSGYQSIEDMDRNLADIMSTQAMEMFVEEMVALWTGVDRLTLEKTYLTKNNETIHTLINWEVGQIGGMRDLANVRLVFTEITDLKKAEQALRESEARYRLFFEQSPLPIIEYDYTRVLEWFKQLRAQGVADLAAHNAAHPEVRATGLQLMSVAGINQAAITLVGAASAREFGEKQRIVYTESIHEVRWQNVLRVWRGERFSEGEFHLNRLDGSLRTISYRWRIILEGGADDLNRRTQTVMVDVTEQRQAVLALRESEARYRELFERAVGGIYRSSADGRFLTLNPAMARVFGFESPAQMIAWAETNSSAAFYTKPGRREEFVALMNQHGFVNDFESEIRHCNGSSVWVSENARAVHDGEKRLLYYDGFVTDITARRRLEAELTRASKLEAVGILAGGIAHDFNNFLTVVLGNMALAEMDTAPGHSIRQMLGNAKKATLRARDLTQQLLTFAKGGDPVRTAVELPELLRESVAFALHGAKARSEFHIAADLWPANADKGQVGQVVQNLVINAVQAMPEGGVITITASNAVQEGTDADESPLRPGRYIFISVADTGVGVAAEHLVKIFDPYFTTKKQGSGLGLATVYSIIKKHQGHIEVESSLGRGTTFRLWLPAASEAPLVQVAEEVVHPALHTRVLFMDDEAPIRDMALLFMQRIGAECEVAADGAEAVKKYHDAFGTDRAFQVVVMDLTVPGGMGGREAMEKLRQIDPQIRAIVSSGYSQDPVLANHSAHGFRGILPKPYSLDQLSVALHEVLAEPARPLKPA
jgi:PAS domain S-box-containing protein